MALTEKPNETRVVDHDEGRRLLDVQAQQFLGISAEEFIRRWDAGEYRADPDRPEVMRVASLLAFAR